MVEVLEIVASLIKSSWTQEILDIKEGGRCRKQSLAWQIIHHMWQGQEMAAPREQQHPAAVDGLCTGCRGSQPAVEEKQLSETPNFPCAWMKCSPRPSLGLGQKIISCLFLPCPLTPQDSYQHDVVFSRNTKSQPASVPGVMVWLWARACGCSWRQVPGSIIYRRLDWNVFCPSGEHSHPSPALFLWAAQLVRLQGTLEIFIHFCVSSWEFSARRSTDSGIFSFNRVTTTTTTTSHSVLLIFQEVKTKDKRMLQCVQGFLFSGCLELLIESIARDVFKLNELHEVFGWKTQHTYHAEIYHMILATSFLLSYVMHQAMWLGAGQVQDTEDQ